MIIRNIKVGLIMILMLFACFSYAQQITENYIISFTPDSAVTDLNALRIAQRHPVVQYMDGLGRPKQTVSVHATPDGQDLVQPIVYDDFGRQSKSYLPFARVNTGELHNNPTDSLNWENHYGDQMNFAFSQKRFDNSPLNRVMEQAAPGSAWQITDGHTVKFEYASNIAGDVVLYAVENDVLTSSSTYEANQLYKTITKDENWISTSGVAHTTEEFKDKQGQVVLKRTYLDDGTALNTYYVYDDYGLLRYVLPPKVFEVEPTSVTSTVLAQLCYQYKYDSRKRMTHKKLPGVDSVYMLYDHRDRLVMTQDGNQNEAGQWLYTLYDEFNRPKETGICSAGTFASLQSSVNASNNYTPSGRTAYSYIYYDDYSFSGKQDFDTIVNVSQYSDATDKPNYHDAVKGQITGTRVKVLEDGKSEWIASTNYYDSKYRLIQQVSRQYSESNSSSDIYRQVVSNDYNFVGGIVTTKESQTVNGTTVDFTKTYEYDHAKRLKKVQHQMGTGSPVILTEMVYDELGQLVQKKIGNNIQTVDYQYNIRGWLTKLNNPASLGTDLFGMELKYNTAINDLSAKAQYNGNISAITWAGHKYTGMRTYGYTYDALNRLKQARYGEGGTYTNLDKYKMSVGSYDLNGNIDNLDRYLNSRPMDKLKYTYIGNQLSTVSDGGLKDQGFVEPANQESVEYDYDLNGNLKFDKNKGLTKVEYNHLNLPKKVLAGSDYISYIYDASGTKLAKKIRTGTTEDVYYRGSFVYKGSSLDYVIHDEGLIDYDAGNYTYQYYLKDHLGNTRSVFKNNGGTAQLEQEQHYYPYGLAIDGLKYTGSTPNKYMYNGKELQDDQLGGVKLDWLDYGARMYDASIGRWHCLDPQAERYSSMSPYNYVANNPMLLIDPNGEEIWIYYKDKEGNEQKTQYTAGMKYGGDNKFVTASVKYLNQMNSSKNGAKVLGTLSDSDNAFNMTNTFVKDKKGDKVPALSFAGSEGGGGQIHAGDLLSKSRSDYGNLENTAHEMFHGFQHEKGQGGASIFNEVEAMVYSKSVADDYMYSSGGFGGGTSTGLGKDNTLNSQHYQNSFQKLLFGTSFPGKSFVKAVKHFKLGAGKNASGDYNRYPLRRANQKSSLLRQFYPLIK